MARRKILTPEEYEAIAHIAVNVHEATNLVAESAIEPEPVGVQIFKRQFEEVFGTPFPE